MSVLIDIISAAVVGGMLVLIALVTTDNGTQELVNYNAAKVVQLDLEQTTQIIEQDIKKIGFGIPETEQGNVLQTVLGNELKFLTHLNLNAETKMPLPGVTTYDNIVDTIKYTITHYKAIDFGDTIVNLYNVKRSVNITSLKTLNATIGKIGNANIFTYLDQIGQTASSAAEVRIVEITLSAFNPKVLLSPSLVQNDEDLEANVQAANSESRKREIRRLLRGSYWKKNRLILRNLNS